MSASPKEAAPKKKGGKLLIILVLLGVLGGGGFFMMKPKANEDGKKEEIIKIGKTPVELGEFLTNLADDRTFVRTEIAVVTREDFPAKDLETYKPAIEMAITGTLRSLTQEDLQGDRTLRKLRRRLATAINKVVEPKEEKVDKEDGHTKSIKVKTEAPSMEIPDDWDSATGPVLQVFPRKFATQ